MELLTVIQMFLLVTTIINAVPSARKKIHKSTYYDCTCGAIGSKTRDRIVGGKITKPHAYPWQALVKVNNGIYGGTAINDLYTLTAAHCAYGIPKKNITVHFGVHDRDNVYHNRHQMYNVKHVQIHENYKYISFPSDIALLKLNRRITFTDFVQPICLPNKNEKIEGKTVTVIGWGLTKWNEYYTSRILRETQVIVLTRKICQENNEAFDNTMICTSSFEHDACSGDSGGPLFYEYQNGRAVQIGIVSFGDLKCGGSGDLLGYEASVPVFLDWIRKHTKDAHYCYKVF